MTKIELIEKISKKSKVPKKEVAAAYAAMLEITYKLATKSSFTVPGLGKIEIVERNARICRNPKTGVKIQVPKRKVLKFHFAKVAKDAILPK